MISALFSFPMRYRHKGHLRNSQRRTSALFPQQQSRHFRRMALPRVILSSIIIFSYVVSSIRQRKRSCKAVSSVRASTIRPETSGSLQSLSASAAVCCSRWRSTNTSATNGLSCFKDYQLLFPAFFKVLILGEFGFFMFTLSCISRA